MQVRGAPLIGATAAYGVALAVAEDPSDDGLAAAMAELAATRPTAVNLRWALAEMKRALQAVPGERRFAAAVVRAGAIAEADVAINRAIGAARRGADRRSLAAQSGRRGAGQCPDPLQRRLARHRRLGYRARPGLPRP